MIALMKFAPVLLGFALAQNATTVDSTTYDVVPTPDAVPIDYLMDVEVPVYTITPGLDSDIIYYASETAIQAASAQQTESPFSVFVSGFNHYPSLIRSNQYTIDSPQPQTCL